MSMHYLQTNIAHEIKNKSIKSKDKKKLKELATSFMCAIGSYLCDGAY